MSFSIYCASLGGAAFFRKMDVYKQIGLNDV